MRITGGGLVRAINQDTVYGQPVGKDSVTDQLQGYFGYSGLVGSGNSENYTGVKLPSQPVVNTYIDRIDVAVHNAGSLIFGWLNIHSGVMPFNFYSMTGGALPALPWGFFTGSSGGDRNRIMMTREVADKEVVTFIPEYPVRVPANEYFGVSCEGQMQTQTTFYIRVYSP